MSNRQIVRYLFLNAGFVNFGWYSCFVWERHWIAGINDGGIYVVIAASVGALYTATLLIAPLLFFIGLWLTIWRKRVTKKLYIFAVWVTIVNPLFVPACWLSFRYAIHKLYDYPLLMGEVVRTALIAIGLSCFHFGQGKRIVHGEN